MEGDFGPRARQYNSSAGILFGISGLLSLHAWWFSGESFCTGGQVPHGRKLLGLHRGWTEIRSERQNVGLRDRAELESWSGRMLLAASLFDNSTSAPGVGTKDFENRTIEGKPGHFQMKAGNANEAEANSEAKPSKPSEEEEDDDGDWQDASDAWSKEKLYIGPNSRVVSWLKCNAAVCTVVVACIFYLSGQSLDEGDRRAECLLQTANAAQVIILLVGTYFSYGNVVPKQCVAGDMGNNYCFEVMWWTCTIWWGCLALTCAIVCFLFCCAAFLVSASSNTDPDWHSGQGRGEYTNLSGNEGRQSAEQAKDPYDPKYDPNDPNNEYV